MKRKNNASIRSEQHPARTTIRRPKAPSYALRHKVFDRQEQSELSSTQVVVMFCASVSNKENLDMGEKIQDCYKFYSGSLFVIVRPS